MATNLAASTAAALLCLLAAGCQDSADEDPSTAAGEAKRACVEAILPEENASDAVAAVADTLCVAIADPASQALERDLAPSDLEQLILTSCGLRSPEPNVDSATHQVRIQLKYRAIGDEDLARRWRDAGLVTHYETDAEGRVSVEFDPEQIAALASLQLDIDEALHEHRQELCP
ncbi:MAG: hypothetical protein ABL966_03680 [Acidimicrobiales bacterium]